MQKKCHKISPQRQTNNYSHGIWGSTIIYSNWKFGSDILKHVGTGGPRSCNFGVKINPRKSSLNQFQKSWDAHPLNLAFLLTFNDCPLPPQQCCQQWTYISLSISTMLPTANIHFYFNIDWGREGTCILKLLVEFSQLWLVSGMWEVLRPILTLASQLLLPLIVALATQNQFFITKISAKSNSWYYDALVVKMACFTYKERQNNCHISTLERSPIEDTNSES